MTILKIILCILLVIVAIPMYIIGFRSNRKSNKLRKNIGDIEIWKMSIILAQEYPKEYKRNKQNSRVFLLGYIILILSLAGLLVSLYTLISYMDSTITVIAALVGIAADILMIIFYRRVLETKLEIQNSLRKVSDPGVQEKLSKFINANQLALNSGKYLFPSFLFLFIGLLVFLTL